MPTSATGTSARPDAGFTLVEAMTTLVIVGLVVGGVMLAAPSEDRRLRAFAESFAARIDAASEESIMRNRPIALRVTRDGFGYERLEARGWTPMDGRTPLAFRAWPQDVAYRLEAPQEAESGRIARFDVMGGASPARLVLERGDARWRVEIDGQGRAHVTRAE